MPHLTDSLVSISFQATRIHDNGSVTFMRKLHSTLATLLEAPLGFLKVDALPDILQVLKLVGSSAQEIESNLDDSRSP
jgi:hypothetical protein